MEILINPTGYRMSHLHFSAFLQELRMPELRLRIVPAPMYCHVTLSKALHNTAVETAAEL